jgi:hypothetical protein
MCPAFNVGLSPELRKILTGSDLRLLGTGDDSIDLLGDVEVGDPLTGRMVKRLAGSRMLMRFRGAELVTKTNLPLSEGDVVKGIVQAKGPPLVLKIVEDEAGLMMRTVARFRSLASHWLPFVKDHPIFSALQTLGSENAEWMQSLTRWLDRSILGDGVSFHPERVREALIQGGILYESKLIRWITGGGRGHFQAGDTDLKGLTLRLLDQLQSQKKGLNGGVKASVEVLESLIGKIELFQTANLLARQQGFGAIFQIPLRFGGDQRTADLFLKVPDQGKQTEKGLHILLLLDLGDLGRFQIDARVSQRQVTAAVGVDRRPTMALVESMIGDLKQGLENQGLAVLKIDCFLAEEPVRTENLIRELLLMDDRDGVSIRV